MDGGEILENRIQTEWSCTNETVYERRKHTVQ